MIRLVDPDPSYGRSLDKPLGSPETEVAQKGVGFHSVICKEGSELGDTLQKQVEEEGSRECRCKCMVLSTSIDHRNSTGKPAKQGQVVKTGLLVNFLPLPLTFPVMQLYFNNKELEFFKS
jgi:hypothetical protein